MEQFIRSFNAWDDRGNRVAVHEWENIVEAKVGAGGAAVSPPHILKTSAGRPIQRIAKGEYRIVQTGAILHCTDADAP